MSGKWELVEAKSVVLKPIDYNLNVEKDPDLMQYIKPRLLKVTLDKVTQIEFVISSSSIQLFVEKTEPEGKVTITEKTYLKLENESTRARELTASKSENKTENVKPIRNIPANDEWFKRHEKRLDELSHRLEDIVKKLGDLEDRKQKQ